MNHIIGARHQFFLIKLVGSPAQHFLTTDPVAMHHPCYANLQRSSYYDDLIKLLSHTRLKQDGSLFNYVGLFLVFTDPPQEILTHKGMYDAIQ